MKLSIRHVVFPLAALLMFGAGCSNQRVIRAPPVVTSASATQATPPPATPTSGWNPIADHAVTSTAVAYIDLNGNGKAQVQRDGQAVAAANGEEVLSGDRISVSSGEVSLIYPGAGETRLESGSDVTIIADISSGSLFAELRLAAGNVWTRFERLLGNDEHFSVAANGVVATVRGTAFGVSVVGDQADVQVADHFVDVASESVGGKGVQIQAGTAIQLRASEFVSSDLPTLRLKIRTLTDAEKTATGFKFALTPLTQDRLRVPLQIVRPFNVAPILRSDLQSRLNLLRSTLPSGFVAPNRGLLNTEIQPGTQTPTTSGPLF